MKNALRDILKGKVVIVGIGNTMKADDGFGPVFIGRIKGKVDAICIDAGTAPENYVGKIAKENPDTVLLCDAVHLERDAGVYEILRPEDVVRSGLTTHDISPGMFIDYLRSRTSAPVYVLGIQPKDVSLGGEMSEEVRLALIDLEKQIKEMIHA